MSEQEMPQTTTQAGLCENCLPDATIWATSTPGEEDLGPKSYFILVKDGETQIAFELKYHQKTKWLIAEPYKPDDYSYTMHDACNHEHDECIIDDPDFQEQLRIDEAAIRAGYKDNR